MPSKQIEKKKSKNHSNNNKDDISIIKDNRFSKIHSDPRFVRPKSKDVKITIDDRFKSALNNNLDNDFGLNNLNIDKYGRKIKHKGKNININDDNNLMKKYYRLENEDEEQEDEENDVKLEPSMYNLARGKAILESSSEEEDFSSDEDEEDEDLDVEELEKKIALEQGLTNDLSSSSSSSFAPTASVHPLSNNYDNSSQSDIPTGEKTNRFAIVNLDWDHIKAKDLFIVFDGFKPLGGSIISVKIYLSEYGKEKLEKENREGPDLGLSIKSREEEEINKGIVETWKEEAKEESIDYEKLRKYQLQRLRYYYAICETDSISTADIIYQTCEGTEYEASANFFDLRFVPNEMKFNEDDIKDICYEIPIDHKSKDFQTTALQHSKVKLTWDNDDEERIKITKRKFTKEDIKDMDFKAYLASDSEEEEEEEDDDANINEGDEANDDEEEEDKDNKLRNKYKSLIKGVYKDINKDTYEKDKEVEIIFKPDMIKKVNQDIINKEKQNKLNNETVFEQQRRKLKEKKKLLKKNNKINNEDNDDLISSDEHNYSSEDEFFSHKNLEDDDDLESENDNNNKNNKNKNKKKRLSKEEREERKQNKIELELLMMDNNDNNKGKNERHFTMKSIIKQKKEEETQDGFNMNYNDDRFKDFYDDYNYSIDPTNTKFKSTNNMKSLLSLKRKRYHNNNTK